LASSRTIWSRWSISSSRSAPFGSAALMRKLSSNTLASLSFSSSVLSSRSLRICASMSSTPALRRRTSAASWSPSAITWCWAAALSGWDWKLCQAAVNLLNRSGSAAVSELEPISVWMRLR
jgi:hypothetical protein